MVNSDKIKKRLNEMGLTQKDIADKNVWNCALPTVSQKINNVRPMGLNEAEALAKLLSLSICEFGEFFFEGK